MASLFATLIINFIINFILSVSFSIILILLFSKKSTNIFIKILAFIMININLFLVLCLISDICFRFAETIGVTEENTSMELVIKICYQLIFWFNTFFPMLIIPFIISYEESGEFTTIKKVKDAFIKTIFGFSFIFIFGGVYIILVLFDKFIIAKVLEICLIQLNSIFAFVFIGFSIVKIPKKMFIHSNMDKSIKYYEFKSKVKKEELDYNLKELELIKIRCNLTLEYINSINNVNTEENKKDENNENEINLKNLNEQKIMLQSEKYVKEMITVFNNDEDLENEKKIENEENNNDNSDNENNENNKDEKINKDKKEPIKTYKDLVKENRKLKELLRNKERIKNEIQRIYNNWYKLKSLSFLIKTELKDNKNEDEDEDSLSKKSLTLSPNENNFIPLKSLSLEKVKFFNKTNRLIYFFLAFFLILSDIIIVYSEISISFDSLKSIFGLIILLRNAYIVNFFFIIIILFLFFLAIYAMVKLKYLKKKNGFFLGKKTDTISLLVICTRLSAVSIPICLNVIEIVTLDSKKYNINFETLLQKHFGKDMNLPTFDNITPFIPLFLIIVIIIFIFNIIGRVCKNRKKINFAFKTEKREEFIEEGRKYLFEIYEKENKIVNNSKEKNTIFDEAKYVVN